MADLQAKITLLDGLDRSRDLAYSQACAEQGMYQCLAQQRSKYIKAQATFMDAHRRLGDAGYLDAYGDVFSEVQEEFNSGLDIDRLAMLDSLDSSLTLWKEISQALGIGAAGGAAAATAVFGGKSIAVCLANPICRVEVGTAITEAAAGDALGGASLLPVVVGGKVAVVSGGKVVGFIDEATGSFKRAADAAYDANAVREAVAATKNARWSRNEFRGMRVYQRNDLIDPNRVDKDGRTSLELMRQGRAPIGPDGERINLHHLNERNDGPLAELTQTMHSINTRTIHINPGTTPSGIDRNAFDTYRRNYWKNRAKDFEQ